MYFVTKDQKQIELEKIKQLLITKYKAQKVILFGSHAWGKPNKDSDFDLLIIKDVDKPRPAREQEIYQLLGKFMPERDMPVDVIVRTPKETADRLSLGDPFVTEVLRRGKVLYEQPGPAGF